jgi:hypothetical protein
MPTGRELKISVILIDLFELILSAVVIAVAVEAATLALPGAGR